MMSRLRSVRRDEQAGFTLVELLVTMSIMAIAFVVILGAISVFFSSTRVHRAFGRPRRGDADVRREARVHEMPATVPCPSTYRYPST